MNTLYKRMENGSRKQRRAYEVMEDLGIIKNYQSFHPVLCGTIPIGIDVENSDLDIIMEVYDLPSLEQRLIKDYEQMEGFRLQRKTIREREVMKANFLYKGFEFEVFAQPQPVHEQHAYLHMIIEDKLLRTTPELKTEILALKRRNQNGSGFLSPTRHRWGPLFRVIGIWKTVEVDLIKEPKQRVDVWITYRITRTCN